jgi:hypothetical protein
MELNTLYIVISSPPKIFIKQNYKYYHNIYSLTIYNKYFGCHAVMRSAAVTTLLLVTGWVIRSSKRSLPTQHTTNMTDK